LKIQAKKPDPRIELRKKFMKQVMGRIGKETERIRNERGGRKIEMDISEIFTTYLNESRPINENNRLMKVLKEKEMNDPEQIMQSVKGDVLTPHNITYEPLLLELHLKENPQEIIYPQELRSAIGQRPNTMPFEIKHMLKKEVPSDNP
jgi:hypothetical protein